MKKAYIFPGQGSQFPGMAEHLYNEDEQAKGMFKKANEILGFNITDIMFRGTAEQLKQTEVTQPAIFLHSVILAKCLPDFNPDTNLISPKNGSRSDIIKMPTIINLSVFST